MCDVAGGPSRVTDVVTDNSVVCDLAGGPR